ncbi:site-specific integrase [Granulicella sp. WH15]|uniref:site-specific integrase n=1 Tax=Granulicella sp. WH15 TaxID=2602070 RepID=UPI0013A54BCB|nr:site-specific integrase [Granulicella sp. WH15]
MSKRKLASEFLANIPPLPASIGYYDGFSDSYGQITEPNRSDQWPVSFDGRDVTLDFSVFDTQVRQLMKSWCALLLSRLSPVTAEYYFYRLSTVPIDQIEELLTCNIQEIKSVWRQLHDENIPYPVFQALKSLLSFLCTHGVGNWRPEWLDLISQLQLPKIDKYASVRMGKVFLTVDEEAAIVRHIDDLCIQLQTQQSSVSTDLLEASAILMCSYQFGLRAKQIAMLEMRNIRIWKDGLDGHSAVHLTFTMIKQRSSNRVFPMVRRVKREWTPLFIELFENARMRGLGGGDHVFHRTPLEVGKVLGDLTESLLNSRRTVIELRHTAAQRLVDAGASEEELAAFMGHTDLNTGLIYFSSSPSQGARINQALGISKTYQNVVKIAHDRFISPAELAELKGDQQIGGVPHGIPIAGIGGCTVGQPSCPYNPVTSCYGCSRFMPVAVAAIHQEVLNNLREVMKLFYSSSHGERGSPAFQIESTISKVQAILDEIGGEQHEPIL